MDNNYYDSWIQKKIKTISTLYRTRHLDGTTVPPHLHARGQNFQTPTTVDYGSRVQTL